MRGRNREMGSWWLMAPSFPLPFVYYQKKEFLRQKEELLINILVSRHHDDILCVANRNARRRAEGCKSIVLD